MATLIPHKIRKPRPPPTTYLGKFPKKHFLILPKTKRCKNWKWQYQRFCAKILHPYFWPRAALVAKYVSLWPSASQPSVRWLLSKSIHYWIYYITYTAFPIFVFLHLSHPGKKDEMLGNEIVPALSLISKFTRTWRLMLIHEWWHVSGREEIGV